MVCPPGPQFLHPCFGVLSVPKDTREHNFFPFDRSIVGPCTVLEFREVVTCQNLWYLDLTRKIARQSNPHLSYFRFRFCILVCSRAHVLPFFREIAAKQTYSCQVFLAVIIENCWSNHLIGDNKNKWIILFFISI